MIDKTKNYLRNYSIINFFINLRDLLSWQKRHFVQPSPNFIKRAIIKKYTVPNSIFIETGTLTGNMIFYLHKSFSFCYSLEPSKKFYDLSSKRLSNIKNKILLNDTSENALEKTIKQILESHKTQKNLVFFLDAHYSGGDTFLAKKATPIILELEIIEKYMLQFDKIIIIVDDIESFGTGDYPKKEFLVNFALKNKKNFNFEHGMFICY